jgi:opacity protein-like surface antigen
VQSAAHKFSDNEKIRGEDSFKMGRFKFVSSGVFAASLISTAGFAADLPTAKAPVPVAAPEPDWSGCYLGAFGGWGFNHADTSIAGVDRLTTTTTTKTKTTTKTTTTTTATKVLGVGGGEFNSGEFGGRVGCQRQFGQFVVGGEISGAGMGLGGTPVLKNALGSTVGTARFRGGGLGEAALKFGYALNNRALLFVRGGVGGIDVETSFYDSKSNYLGHASNGGVFGTIGGGGEYRVNDHVSVTAEYGYWRGRCGSIAFNDNISRSENFVGAARSCISQSSVTLGLNYYFPTSWPVGPNFVKY